ncbi:MAG: phosphoenolpyruvate carboxykinase (ATP), partial [Planctomycetota bacterium]
ATLDAALSGALDVVPYETDRIFGLRIPQRCPGVPRELLRPDLTWSDAGAYEAQAQVLVNLFHENFKQFANEVSAAVRAAGPG